MGKDLHYIVEKTINNKWVGIMATDCLFSTVKNNIKTLRRSRRFFACINDEEGFPDDASELALHEKARIEGHSHSWLKITDIYHIWVCLYHPSLRGSNRSLDETLILQAEFSEFIGVNFLGEEDNGFWINDNLRILFFFDN